MYVPKHIPILLIRNHTGMCPHGIYSESYSLRQTIFSLLRNLSGTTLDLTYEVAPDVPDILIDNSYYLRQVIHILVTNAIKSTPSFDAQTRGHVSLSTRLIASDDENVVLEFCVMDTGLGVTKDFLDLFLGTKVMFVCLFFTRWTLISENVRIFFCQSASVM